MDTYEEQLQAILDGSNLPQEKKEEILLKAVGTLAPIAYDTSEKSANGEFLKILMQLLVQFLPILLKLLAG